MPKNRLEAFSDGVIAILITIMVLELKVPHDSSLSALIELWPVFLSYVLSFIYLGIYWNNHHHLLHTVKHVTGSILWGNLILLFWLSLVPFATTWMGENHFSGSPVALYGFILLMSAMSYFYLQHAIICSEGESSLLKTALGSDKKGKISPLIYVVALICAYPFPWLAQMLYALVAIIWLIPDRRIEKVISHGKQ